MHGVVRTTAPNKQTKSTVHSKAQFFEKPKFFPENNRKCKYWDNNTQ